MALLFMDSFDHWGTTHQLMKYTANPNGSMTVGAVGRNSTNGGTFGQTVFGGSLRLGLAPSGTTCIIGKAVRYAALPTNNELFTILDGTSDQCQLRVKSDGALEFRRGAATVLGTSSAGVLSSATTYYIELKVVIHNSAGAYDVRVNGVSVLSGSGADTQQTANAQWTAVELCNLATSLTITGDDLYILDGTGSVNNDFLGDHRVVAALPDGVGNDDDWTPTSGDNYTNVDDATPDDETTVVSSGTVGHTDLHTYAALGVTGDVRGVQFLCYAKADRAGMRDLVAVCRIGGTTYEHPTAQTLGGDWRYYRWIWENSPATSTPWTVAEIDDAEFGYRVVA